MHFVWRFEHEMHFHKIFVKTAEYEQTVHHISDCTEFKQRVRGKHNFNFDNIAGYESWMYG